MYIPIYIYIYIYIQVHDTYDTLYYIILYWLYDIILYHISHIYIYDYSILYYIISYYVISYYIILYYIILRNYVSHEAGSEVRSSWRRLRRRGCRQKSWQHISDFYFNAEMHNREACNILRILISTWKQQSATICKLYVLVCHLIVFGISTLKNNYALCCRQRGAGRSETQKMAHPQGMWQHHEDIFITTIRYR